MVEPGVDVDPSFNLRILWVDDDKFMITAFSHMLGALGCDDLCTISGKFAGQDAIELIRSQHFDVVITDRKMPHIDGFTVAEAVRQVDAVLSRPPTPVLMVTISDVLRQFKRDPHGGVKWLHQHRDKWSPQVKDRAKALSVSLMHKPMTKARLQVVLHTCAHLKMDRSVRMGRSVPVTPFYSVSPDMIGCFIRDSIHQGRVRSPADIRLLGGGGSSSLVINANSRRARQRQGQPRPDLLSHLMSVSVGQGQNAPAASGSGCSGPGRVGRTSSADSPSSSPSSSASKPLLLGSPIAAGTISGSRKLLRLTHTSQPAITFAGCEDDGLGRTTTAVAAAANANAKAPDVNDDASVDTDMTDATDLTGVVDSPAAVVTTQPVGIGARTTGSSSNSSSGSNSAGKADDQPGHSSSSSNSRNSSSGGSRGGGGSGGGSGRSGSGRSGSGSEPVVVLVDVPISPIAETHSNTGKQGSSSGGDVIFVDVPISPITETQQGHQRPETPATALKAVKAGAAAAGTTATSTKGSATNGNNNDNDNDGTSSVNTTNTRTKTKTTTISNPSLGRTSSVPVIRNSSSNRKTGAKTTAAPPAQDLWSWYDTPERRARRLQSTKISPITSPNVSPNAPAGSLADTKNK